jgi:hypothetical protein
VKVTPFARGGLDAVLLPFFYVQFKAVDERLEVGLNQLFTDLVFACQKMKGIRQLARQMDDSPVGLVFGSAMTPRYWELYAAWQDEDGPVSFLQPVRNQHSSTHVLFVAYHDGC